MKKIIASLSFILLSAGVFGNTTETKDTNTIIFASSGNDTKLNQQTLMEAQKGEGIFDLLTVINPEDPKFKAIVEDSSTPSFDPKNLTYEQKRIIYIGALFCAATYIDSKKINGGNNYQECWDELVKRGWNPNTILNDYTWPGEFIVTGKKTEDGISYYFLAIRGTVYPWQWYGINAILLPVYYPETKNRIHAGFAAYTASFIQTDEVAQFINEAKNDPNGKLIVCGQSLGGASAVIAAEFAYKHYNFPKDRMVLLTIAQPCVGFPEFIEMASKDLPEYYRIADYCDIAVIMCRATEIFFGEKNSYQHFGTKIMTWELTDYEQFSKIFKEIQQEIREKKWNAAGSLVFKYHIMKNYLPYITAWTKDYNGK